MYAFVLLIVALMGTTTAFASGQKNPPLQTGTAMPLPDTTPIPGLPGLQVGEILNSSGHISAVALYESRQQVQTLSICTDKPIAKTGELGTVAFADFNFDGYPDLAMLVASADENNTYCVWLFDPQTKRLVLSEGLSHLTNPSPDDLPPSSARL